MGALVGDKGFLIRLPCTVDGCGVGAQLGNLVQPKICQPGAEPDGLNDNEWGMRMSINTNPSAGVVLDLARTI